MGKEGKKGKVAIISRESDTRTLDIEMLEAELNRRGIETETLTKLFTKDKSAGDATGYLGTVMKQEAAIARADVVVLDTYCIPISMLPHPGTRVVQMWHALSAVKKFGWQTVGSEDGTSLRTAKMMRMHKGYDYVVCASDVTAEYFSEAFRIDRSKIVKYGLPRIDYIKSVTHGDGRYKAMGAIYALYPHLMNSDKKVVLYAPTFRKGSMPDVKGLADALDPEKYELIVKLHPLYREDADLPKADNIRYEETIPTYDLLAGADIIISDYSSLVVEASLADKPMYLYTYDIDTYSETTGLNMDFGQEPIGKYVFCDARELAAAIDRQCWSDPAQSEETGKKEDGKKRKPQKESYDMDALRAFRDKYIDIDTENCTGALADFIESLIPERKLSDSVGSAISDVKAKFGVAGQPDEKSAEQEKTDAAETKVVARGLRVDPEDISRLEPPAAEAPTAKPHAEKASAAEAPAAKPQADKASAAEAPTAKPQADKAPAAKAAPEE